MIVKLLTEHHFEFLSLTEGCRGSSEFTLAKMSNCWKSHTSAQLYITCFMFQVMDPGSSLVRHMSMKAGGTKRTSLDRDTRSVMAVGKDNKGYDNTTDAHENLKVL